MSYKASMDTSAVLPHHSWVQTFFMLSQLGCLSTFSVDVSINGMKISVSVISTKGILPARHVGFWEPRGKLKGKLWLHSSANESQLGHREVSGAAKAEIGVVGVYSGSHERERAPTILVLFLDSYLPQAVIEPCPKSGANYCTAETLGLVDSPISVSNSQAKAMIWYYDTACRTNKRKRRSLACLFLNNDIEIA